MCKQAGEGQVKAIIIAAALIMLLPGLSGEAALAARACPSGMITCAHWCAKYRPGASDCLVGPRSCAEMSKGSATCVGDVCNPRNGSCGRQRRGASRSGIGDSCSGQNRICEDYCLERHLAASCHDDCAGRMRSCVKTGTYYWRNSPSVTGLTRR
jgi:hypothetical protein